MGVWGPVNAHLDDMVRSIIEARRTLARPGPDHLSRFIARSGGIRLSPEDSRGEIEAILAHLPTPQARARLARPSGKFPVDMAREHAEQARYLTEDPSLRGFLDALDNDVRGNRVYPAVGETYDAVARRADAQRLIDDLDQHGIDPTLPLPVLHADVFRRHPAFMGTGPIPRRSPTPRPRRQGPMQGPNPMDIPFGFALAAGGGSGALGALMNRPNADDRVF